MPLRVSKASRGRQPTESGTSAWRDVLRGLTPPARLSAHPIIFAARSVFPSILEMIRGLNEGRPGGGLDGAKKAVGAFGPVSAQVAGAAFRQAAQSV